jgi:2-polyprenyl-6-methoxyphenol hydroxylase-like FAD-dependent oxidoreductase
VDYDVLVVGGGPTGMMLAAELRLAGVRPLVVERLTQPYPFSKALGIHSRSIELLELRGIHDRFLEGAPLLSGGHFASLPVGLNYQALETRHPYGLYQKQVDTERLLTERALELGTEIRRGVELTGLAQDAGGVTATLTGPDGEYQVRAGYLVGCDGGRSRTRKLAGIEFPGQEPGLTVLMADAEFSGELPSGEGMGPLRPHGVIRQDLRAWFSAVPLFEPGVYRAMVFRYDHAWPDRNAPVTEEEMRAAITELAGSDCGLTGIRWLTRLTDVSRQAARYREGRVLLAGDAAHVHFPSGGPGLNMGLQDAMNLGWKLAAMVNGWGTDELLDSYHAERHPVGQTVLRNTRTQCALFDPDPRLDAVRETFTELLRIDQVNRYFTGLGSALDVRYDLPGEHPLTGTRMPDLDVLTEDGVHRLSSYFHDGLGALVGAGIPLPGWKDRVTVVDWRVKGPAMLVRPDGYVCWAGDPVADDAGLNAALRRWFGAPAY